MSAASPRGRARAPLALSVVAIAGLVLAACSAGATAKPSGSVAASAGTGSLEGTPWLLTEYVGPGGNTVPVPEGVAATATFADGKISGSSGCNTYFGSYTVDGEALTISGVGSTMMACGPVATALETAFLASLKATETFSVSGDTLELRTAGGKVGLKFKVEPTPELTGTRWVATMINNGKGAVSGVVDGSTVTAIFAEGGKVAGSGGCNDYNGTYTVDGASMKFGPVASTKKLCNDPAGVDEQEAAYFIALGNVTTFAFDGDRLQLRDGTGALQVEYQPTLSR